MSKLSEQLKGIESMNHMQRAEKLHQASEQHTIAEIAAACGKSSIWVNNYTKLYWFPKKIKDLLISGQVGLIELIKTVASYHQADPNKYDKAYKDLLAIIEEKKKKTPAKRGRKKSTAPKLPELKRYHRSVEWIKSELESKEKRSAVEQRSLEVVDLILAGGKKDEVIGELHKILDNTAGRK